MLQESARQSFHDRVEERLSVTNTSPYESSADGDSHDRLGHTASAHSCARELPVLPCEAVAKRELMVADHQGEALPGQPTLDQQVAANEASGSWLQEQMLDAMTVDDDAIDTQLELKRAEEKSELKHKVRFHLFPKPGGADCRVPDCSDSNVLSQPSG